MNRARRRNAFTLVELLVVASIFAMLFGMIALGSRPNPRGQVRLAAQQLASLLLATQTRALGSNAGAGLLFEPSGMGGRQCVTVYNANLPPYLEGTATGMPPATLSATTATVTVTPTTGTAADLQNGYRIQFSKKGQNTQPAGAWMGFMPSSTVTLRTLDGQTASNTIWPKPVGGGNMDVRVACYPTAGSTALSLPKGAAIDLQYSGGDNPNNAWGNLANKGFIGLVYDALGGLDTLMQQVTSTPALRTIQPCQPTGPFYLFVVSQAELNNLTASTLASDQSLWVVVHPQTGRVTVSSNLPQTTASATTINAARKNARNGVPIGK